MQLVDRDRILALSPDATADFSYMRDYAVGIPTVRPTAEDALVLRPDLIIRSYGGGPNATVFFERAGIPVLNVGWAGSLEDVKTVIAAAAEGLNAVERGQATIDEMNDRLAALRNSTDQRTALYMTPSGVTTGPNSLVHEMLLSAGYQNFEARPGWHSIPLERLAYERPNLVVAAFFDEQTNHISSWSAARHPIARAQLLDQPMVPISGAWTACGGWFLLDAIEALAGGAPGGEQR